MTKPIVEKKPLNPPVDSDSDSSDDEDYVPDDKADIQSDIEEDSDDSDTEQNNNDYDGEYDLSSTRSGKRRGAGGSEDTHKKHPLEDTINQAEALRKKSKIDALWAELNTPIISKPNSRPELLTAVVSSSSSGSNSKPEVSSSSKMVTITTTYDFAGETITVTKDVPEDSKEAKEFARKNKDANTSPATQDVTEKSRSDQVSSISSTAKPMSPSPSTANDSAPSIDTNLTPDPSDSVATSTPSSESATATISTNDSGSRPSMLDSLAQKSKLVRYVRKKSILDELAATYGVKKPPKMNTLEKSKLDWKNFVGKEGIEDELKHHNKDGYMEKVAFLQRTDEHRDREYQMLKKRR
ncbi:Craniofacial development protein 1 [Mortierella sp. AD011]|nr:Craniofacial development protein 1 [Mortierella sp. AD010]KAF9398158.1 Craniofacial development protein 1 [Mortierella sp. AD011]